MKNKGFTLVELLGVITLLVILVFIAVPSVSKSIQNSRERAYEAQLGNLITAATSWGTDHISQLPTESGQSVQVTVGELKEGKYIDDEFENPKTKENFSDDTYVTITKVNETYQYEVTVVD